MASVLVILLVVLSKLDSFMERSRALARLNLKFQA